MQDVRTEFLDDPAQTRSKVERKGDEARVGLNSSPMNGNMIHGRSLTWKSDFGLETKNKNRMTITRLSLGEISNEPFDTTRDGWVIFTNMKYFHLSRRKILNVASHCVSCGDIWLPSFLLTTALVVFAGCSQGIRRPDAVDDFIQAYNANELIFQENYFDVLTLLKGKRGDALRIYIEGDGLAWLNKHTVSGDPTPREPIALQLALLDSFPLILYLARPCQYVTGPHRRNCLPQVWTSARFAEPVVADLNSIIDKVKARSGATHIELIGFSGGGGLATLIAARRDDVCGILTLAGNLNHEAWTALHKVSPLSDSLNPQDYARNIAQIPQLHMVGEEDEVVPAFIARDFVARLSANGAQVVVLKGVGHTSGWMKEYKDILRSFNLLCSEGYRP